MRPVFLALAVFGLSLAQAAIAPPAAQAAIVCKDGFQKSGGNWISTPYCNDADLAHIARKHGVKVSADEVRRDPSKKYELCRFLGSGRTGTYCAGEDGSDRGR